YLYVAHTHPASYSFSFYYHRPPLDLHSFPTRRSSDLFFSFSLSASAGWSRSAILRESSILPLPSISMTFTRTSSPSVSTSWTDRSEEHTSELQSRGHLVCRLLLEKKKNNSLTSCNVLL